MTVEARELRVALPAGEFRVLEWPGPEPPVLLLHGLTAMAEAWTAVAEAVGGRRRLLALDQRGACFLPQNAALFSVVAGELRVDDRLEVAVQVAGRCNRRNCWGRSPRTAPGRVRTLQECPGVRN